MQISMQVLESRLYSLHEDIPVWMVWSRGDRGSMPTMRPGRGPGSSAGTLCVRDLAGILWDGPAGGEC